MVYITGLEEEIPDLCVVRVENHHQNFIYPGGSLVIIQTGCSLNIVLNIIPIALSHLHMYESVPKK